MSVRIGFGYDSHRFKDGDYIVIGGEKISFDKGLDAHSDGDVLLHALCDALLGAAAMGDIGKHFPDNDPKYKDIDSSTLVNSVVNKLDKKNYIVGNIDSTIILEKPKLATIIPEMQKNVSNLLNISLANVNVKATTNEGMGFVGSSEGIAAYVTVILIPKD
ncbi:MAG: 2-C-methyl-D-erythritol 2,4-cyclodiphosphate synthase [Gammaproteobacteria bacterium]|nr:2-C-methyl-D-erythritol 2,4-cyclodiphosphate synthase [Gammaproteobacteria bacterium]NNC69049.1 2-C-methyl-D-erythritol 2,4-cyclodiphosphate synthase [Gammaproteobacteria bacterium]